MGQLYLYRENQNKNCALLQQNCAIQNESYFSIMLYSFFDF